MIGIIWEPYMSAKQYNLNFEDICNGSLFIDDLVWENRVRRKSAKCREMSLKSRSELNICSRIANQLPKCAAWWDLPFKNIYCEFRSVSKGLLKKSSIFSSKSIFSEYLKCNIEQYQPFHSSMIIHHRCLTGLEYIRS